MSVKSGQRVAPRTVGSWSPHYLQKLRVGTVMRDSRDPAGSFKMVDVLHDLDREVTQACRDDLVPFVTPTDIEVERRVKSLERWSRTVKTPEGKKVRVTETDEELIERLTKLNRDRILTIASYDRALNAEKETAIRIANKACAFRKELNERFSAHEIDEESETDSADDV